jgi:NADH-quinone oxidoreductase subunit I
MPDSKEPRRSNVLVEIGNIAKGLGTTLKHMRRPSITEEYPEKARPMFPRFRGRHRLLRYENGLERCIGCSLCAAICPANAILVEAAENTDEDRHSPGERYAKVYEINMLRCIYCGYCQEACPTEAIVLGQEYELADDSRAKLIFTKEELLVPLPEPTPR